MAGAGGDDGGDAAAVAVHAEIGATVAGAGSGRREGPAPSGPSTDGTVQRLAADTRGGAAGAVPLPRPGAGLRPGQTAAAGGEGAAAAGLLVRLGHGAGGVRVSWSPRAGRAVPAA